MTEPLTPEEEREVRASMLPASHTYLWVLVRRLLATLDAARSTEDGWWHPSECIDRHDEDHNCLDDGGSIIGWREPLDVARSTSEGLDMERIVAAADYALDALERGDTRNALMSLRKAFKRAPVALRSEDEG